MEYFLGAALGAAIALVGAFLGRKSAASCDAKPQRAKNTPDAGGESLLRQWNNLLSYCGREQHDED